MCVLVAACAKPVVPAMHGGEGLAPPPGTIVFVRPPSPCDTTDHARIVDAEGHFIGALGSGTWFSVANVPGEQTFYVWPGLDLRLQKYPEFQPVGAIKVRAGEDRVTYVGVRVSERHERQCWKYAVFHFTRPDAAEAEHWMGAAHELVPDRAEGDALLARDADVSRAYMEMSRARLEQRESK